MNKNSILPLIAQQITAAKRSPAFATPTLRFTETSKAALQDSDFLAFLSVPDNLFWLSSILAEQIKEHLFRTMPYIEMDAFAEELLSGICRSLFLDVKRKYKISDIERKHLQRYKIWLRIVGGCSEMSLQQPGCTPNSTYAEYTAPLQLSVLQLNLQRLKTPLLDIGCGAQGNLVTYLRNYEIPAFGLDRVADDSSLHLIQQYWWDFNFIKEAWGTITAHLSFSTHFTRAHLLNAAVSAATRSFILPFWKHYPRAAAFTMRRVFRLWSNGFQKLGMK